MSPSQMLATGRETQTVSGTPPVDPPAQRRAGRMWSWWSSGTLLVLGGAANFVGAWLRWFGPQRQPGLGIRQDDSARPLTTGEHVVPYSSEFTAAGHLLVAAALVVLIFLAWGRLRWIAAPALLLGAYSFAGQAVLWLRESLTGIDSHPAMGTDSPMVDGWSWWAWFPVISLWPLGLAPVVVLACAARRAVTVSSVGVAGAGSPTPGGGRIPDRARRWGPVVAVCALLTVSSVFFEYVLLMLFDDSHDDPQGYGMYSGAAQALAGAFLLIGAVRGRRPRARAGIPGEVERVAPAGGRSRSWSRGRGALQLGGALVALSGLVGVVALLLPPESEAAVTSAQDAGLTATTVVAIAGHALYAVGVLALVAGPWGGLRRVLAALSAAISLVPPVASIVLIALPEVGQQLAWLAQDVPSSAWHILGAVGFTVTVTLERLAGPRSDVATPPLLQLPLLLATVLVVVGQPLLIGSLVTGAAGPEGSLVPPVVGAAVSALWGLAWWVTGRAGRSHSHR